MLLVSIVLVFGGGHERGKVVVTNIVPCDQVFLARCGELTDWIVSSYSGGLDLLPVCYRILLTH